jgi:hypothetical protein
MSPQTSVFYERGESIAKYNRDFDPDPEILHQFSCGHSVERDDRMMPISSRKNSISTRSNTLKTYYDFKCDKCELNDNVEKPVVELIKEQIVKVTKAFLRNNLVDVFHASVDFAHKVGPAKVVVSFWIWEGEDRATSKARLVNTIACAARKLDGKNEHQWKFLIDDIEENATLRAIIRNNTALEKLWKKHEEKWNETNQPPQIQHEIVHAVGSPVRPTQAQYEFLNEVDPPILTFNAEDDRIWESIIDNSDAPVWDIMLDEISEMRESNRQRSPPQAPPPA